jgi:hypothetical protein
MYRRLAIFVVTAAALLAIAVPGAEASRFRTYPSCFVLGHESSGNDHSCFEGDGFGAVFISRRLSHIHYRFCWRRPDGKHDCVRKGPIGRRHKSTVALSRRQGRHGVGTWKLKWKHAGHVIDRDSLHVGSEGV